MKVVATAKGHFKRVRTVGEEFDVPNDMKGSWFTPVKTKASKSPKKNEDDAKDGEDLV